MAATTAAGTTLAICASLPATDDAAGYAALAWTKISKVESIGAIGGTAEVVTFQPYDGPTQKHKGPVNYGSLQPSIAHDSGDPGQAILRAAADSANGLYAFRAIYPTGPIRYFQARVFGYPETIGAANTIVMVQPTIEINTRIVRVAASGVVDPTPVLTPGLFAFNGAAFASNNAVLAYS